jgi:RNA polymerase sigma factor for flagellar operon FliA
VRNLLLEAVKNMSSDQPKTREELIQSFLPLVHHLLGRMAIYLPSYIAKDDLISAGIMGLIDAVDRYDATKGTQLKTYCSIRIRGAIVDELRKMDWVPRSVHRDAKTLQAAQETLAQRLGREANEEEIRQEMKLDENEFQILMDRVKPATYFSLQDVAFTSDGEGLTNAEVIEDHTAEDSLTHLLGLEDRELLFQLMQKLPQKQLQVLSLYYMEGLRLKEIAQVLDITESRVSQIHALAVTRLRGAFEQVRKN